MKNLPVQKTHGIVHTGSKKDGLLIREEPHRMIMTKTMDRQKSILPQPAPSSFAKTRFSLTTSSMDFQKPKNAKMILVPALYKRIKASNKS